MEVKRIVTYKLVVVHTGIEEMEDFEEKLMEQPGVTLLDITEEEVQEDGKTVQLTKDGNTEFFN